MTRTGPPAQPGPDTPGLHVDRDGPVWTVRLDRPRTRNALDPATAEALARVWSDVDADPAARVVVLTGTGSVFCSGADLREIGDPGAALAVLEALLLGPTRIGVPVVAAVNGGCFGGGMSLLLACDLRLAASSARFGTQAARMGLYPFGAVGALTREIGTAAAADLLLTGRHFDAAEAAGLGVVGRVCAPEDLGRRGAGPRRGDRRQRAADRRRDQAHLLRGAPPGVAAERDAALAVLASDDAREGAAAFLARRPARFLGR
ncbi:enoyl-CoA hydratase/isomerase family protein [Pseudonocardia sp. RS010]|uniref:enoyl-CoA hydratase/isomerase family protein n=1 Tax=Pseudonocardia sp. RS010 TaxID=3385979 RepID=UPI00399FA7A2